MSNFPKSFVSSTVIISHCDCIITHVYFPYFLQDFFSTLLWFRFENTTRIQILVLAFSFIWDGISCNNRAEQMNKENIFFFIFSDEQQIVSERGGCQTDCRTWERIVDRKRRQSKRRYRNVTDIRTVGVDCRIVVLVFLVGLEQSGRDYQVIIDSFLKIFT